MRNYGVFLILGNAGCISSTVGVIGLARSTRQGSPPWQCSALNAFTAGKPCRV